MLSLNDEECFIKKVMSEVCVSFEKIISSFIVYKEQYQNFEDEDSPLIFSFVKDDIIFTDVNLEDEVNDFFIKVLNEFPEYCFDFEIINKKDQLNSQNYKVLFEMNFMDQLETA